MVGWDSGGHGRSKSFGVRVSGGPLVGQLGSLKITVSTGSERTSVVKGTTATWKQPRTWPLAAVTWEKKKFF